MAPDPAERSLLGRLAIHCRWADEQDDLIQRASHYAAAEDIRDQLRRRRALAAIADAVAVLGADSAV